MHKAEQCNWDIWGVKSIATTNTINIVQDYFNATTNTINIVNVQDYFNEVDEATDCEEPRAKTVNLYRFFYFLF